MALSPKEREHIVEEETLRLETRRNVAAGDGHGCGRHRRRRWLWFLAFFILGYAVRGCHDRRVWDGGCRWESGLLQGRCPFAQPQADQPSGGAVSPDVKSTPQP